MKSLSTVVSLILLGLGGSAMAWQPAPPAAPKPATPAAPRPAGAKTEDKGPPAPAVEQITTKDNVTLTITYYESPKAEKNGKTVVPIILLHGHKGQRANCEVLAKDLQAYGFAVVTPDLRGSGASNTITLPNGEEKKLDAAKFTNKEFPYYLRDLDAVKSFLRKKNNEAKLNLEALVVIGADASACAAMNWAVVDWNAPILANYKNAQDVKALVLLSPQPIKGYAIEKDALTHPVVGKKLPVMISAGKKGRSAFDEARRLGTTLERNHTQTADTPEDEQRIWLKFEDANVQGTELLVPSLQARNNIHKFLGAWVVGKMEEFKWTERISPND